MNVSAAERPLLSRIRDTFVAPRRLFAGFHRPAPWLGVLVISTLVAALGSALEPSSVFLEQMEDPVTRRGEPVEITSDPSAVVRYGRILAAMSALVVHPLVAFGLAGLLTLLFSVLGRGEVSFRQYLPVASHLLLIPALGMLVSLLLRAATGNPEVQLSPALLPGVPSGGLLGAVAAGFNVFSVWMLVVAAIAVDELEPRIGVARAGALLVGLYLFIVVLAGVLLQP